jgi:ketosteroid isomerase-like protein
MSATDRAAVEEWVAAYRRAWASDEPADIAALFTEDATYSPSPFSESWRGRDAIVDEWIKRGDSGSPWAFEHEVLAADGPVGVVQGLTTYGATDKNPETIYGNIWIVTLAPDGRASSFAEWWVQRPEKKA